MVRHAPGKLHAEEVGKGKGRAHSVSVRRGFAVVSAETKPHATL
jgi:hypothetical protein